MSSVISSPTSSSRQSPTCTLVPSSSPVRGGICASPQIEAAVSEGSERLKARWQLEQAARERESKQREREAAERARGVR